MDFVKLNSGTYFPETLIEGYNSLVWAERYSTLSDFELKTYDVDRMRKLLPEGAFVSHLETRETMQVETHEIAEVGTGRDVQDELTIKGRCVSNIFEQRGVEAQYQKKRTMRKRYTASNACCVLMWQAVNNTSGKDVTRGDIDPKTPAEYNDYNWNTLDRLPNVQVTDSTPNDGALRNWLLEEGILWPQLEKMLNDADYGVRGQRPSAEVINEIVISVESALANRGNVIRSARSGLAQLCFDLYSGQDLRNSVVFADLQGHLVKAQYLTTNQDYKTAAAVRAGVGGSSTIYRNNTEAGYSGWNRRVMDFDAGSPEIPPEPQKPEELKDDATKAEREQRRKDMDKWRVDHFAWRTKRDAIVETFRAETNLMAQRALKQQRRKQVFTADTSETAPYIYGKHYNLGDLVTIRGKYGFSSTMRVEEFVRTENAEGDRGFPGLVAP